MLCTFGMQLRESQLQGDRPQCPVDSNHCVDCHAKYDRFANCDEETKIWIKRYLCRRCRHTISILPDGMLPYRPISVPLVEASFDAKSSGKPEPPVSEKERGCLKRAWARFRQRVDVLLAVLGQMIKSVKPNANECWNQLRRYGNLKQILHLLSRKYKRSLLGDYQCLQPWPTPSKPRRG